MLRSERKRNNDNDDDDDDDIAQRFKTFGT
jgi:hypothetical protein